MFKNFHPQILWILFFIPSFISAGRSDQNDSKFLHLGNFSLPPSQQPGPLIGFGENILNQGLAQLFFSADAFIGKNQYTTDAAFRILYGIRDDLSFFFSLPFSPGNKSREDHSSGLEDIFAQVEYAFYRKKNSDSSDQATIVANAAFPTGSSSKNPPTGFGSNSFFVGATFNHTEIHWFFFTSPGAILTTSKHGSKFGNQFLYQFGLGRNIPSPSGWIFAWEAELDGLYSWKRNIKNLIDPDSGSNVIYFTPSLWASSKRIILQLGLGYPIIQHLFGDQSKKFLSFDFNFGITF